MNLISILTSPS